MADDSKVKAADDAPERSLAAVGAHDAQTETETDRPDMVPAQMVGEFIFCPRRFYLQWVLGEEVPADSSSEESSSSDDSPADKTSDAAAPQNQNEILPGQTESKEVHAPALGITGKADILKGENSAVCPVIFKRGAAPEKEPEGAWEADRIQAAAYALALRENGCKCDAGIVFYQDIPRRVEIAVDGHLEELTHQAIRDLRACADARLLPPPLHLSPKCGGCAFNVVCLPDEIDLIQGKNAPGDARLLYAPRDDALPLYIQTQGARLGIADGILQIHPPPRSGQQESPPTEEIRLNELSQVNIFGNVGMSSAVIRELCSNEIPTAFFSQGGWFFGRLEGMPHKNIELRRAQFRAAEDRDFCLRLSRRIVSAKITNSRTMVRRNHVDPPPEILKGLERAAHEAKKAASLQELLGIEGNGAKIYFSAFAGMLKIPEEAEGETLSAKGQKRSDAKANGFTFDFMSRNRRPPKDPVNALLSYAYGMLTKDMTHAVIQAGFDPLLGFYHQPRYGKPGLALDLMEEFRPLVADSVVLQCINTGLIQEHEFVRSGLGVGISKSARRKLIQTYERRMDQLITHPVFGYRISYRRVLAVQARLLGRYLMGEIEDFPAFLTR